MYFIEDDVLRLDYGVANLGEETLAVLWTAHPQFIATEYTRIYLPKEVKQLLCVYGGRTLEKGRNYEWPVTHSADRTMRRFDRIGPAQRGDSRKFYVNGPVESGWAGLYEQNSGEFLTMAWSPSQVPYLGIWIDEGNFNDRAVCALEPSNGFYDNLSEAIRRGNTLIVKPGAVTDWQLDVRLGCGSREEMEELA
jgi:galactose mutarotase-like enzyme